MIAQTLDPSPLPLPPQRSSWDWTQAGVAIALSAWVLTQLFRMTQTKSQRDDALLAAAINNQQTQNNQLIKLVAEQQAETRQALDDLREAIDDLRDVMRAGAGLPYRPIPSHPLPTPSHFVPERKP